jgi:hypothetical protein
MTFIHPLLLGGLLLIGIPVLIHMVMRQKPKHLLFPAVRFLLQKQQSNRRRLQLRHLLLLALRIILIAAVCLALARPRILNERLNLAADRPVAAVLVFDTSYSMGYVSGGQNRLQLAIQQGLELLKDFPDGSAIAVLDTSEQGGEWLSPPGMAKEMASEKINGLELRPNSLTVTTAVATAYDLLSRLDQESAGPEEAMPRFLYVFSDRTEACWDGQQLENLKRQRDRIPPPGVHAVFVDVGVDNPTDVAISDLTLPRPVISPRDRVILRATVRATGTGIDTEAVCEIDGTVVDKRLIRLAAGQSEVISFEHGELPIGPHQALVSFKTDDATLAFNDKRYATFEVRSPRRVLIIVQKSVENSIPINQFWTEALRIKSLGNFECDEKLARDIDPLAPADLDNYRAICLLGVQSPRDDLWEKLERYVRKGGGLAVIPGGRELVVDAYESAKAQAVLPARLVELLRAPSEKEAVITWNWEKASSHPLLAPFQQWRRDGKVDFFETGREKRVFRYWKVEPRPGAASEIISYTDKENLPALVERHFEDKTHGKVLLFTTGLDNDHVTADPRDPNRMNDYLQLPVSFFLALAQKSVGYLTGDAEEANFNYRCGQAVPVRLPGDSRLTSYTLVGPGISAQEALINRGENDSELSITKAVKEGNYRVMGEGNTIGAFSLNVAPEESILDRVPAEKIEALFGEGAVLPLDAKSNLREALQGHWSQPVELLPWLMIVVLLVLAVENLLANKFYRREPEEGEKAPALQAVSANQ